MKAAISILLAVLAISGAFSGPVVVTEEITSWEQFKKVFNKVYESPADEAFRKSIFEESLRFVQENHRLHHGVELAINENSDRMPTELAMNMESMEEMLRQLNRTVPQNGLDIDEYDALPVNFDWRDHADLNPIANQGSCGSCWAFATSFTVEAQLQYRHKTKVLLSKQELVDCSSTSYDAHYQNKGCQIGYPPEAYRYILEHGIYPADVYPYNGAGNEVCYTKRLLSENRGTKYHINGHNRLAVGISDQTIQQVLHTYGPTVVVIHGTHPLFTQYKGGIIRNLLPNSAEVNHVVAVVGWGTENGVDYWTIRNSWGPNWGEHGYGRIERHHSNLAFNKWVSYPIIQ